MKIIRKGCKNIYRYECPTCGAIWEHEDPPLAPPKKWRDECPNCHTKVVGEEMERREENCLTGLLSKIFR